MTQPKSIIPLTHFAGTGAAHAASTCPQHGPQPSPAHALPCLPLSQAVPATPAAGKDARRDAHKLLARESRQDQACRIFGRGKRSEHCQLGNSSSLPSPTL